MPALELRLPSGSHQSIQLSEDTPVSIGRHQSNDLQIDDESVEQLHCRVSYQKSAYRVNSAGSAKVYLNGKQVDKAKLKIGDVIKVGDFEIIMLGEHQPLIDDQARADISEFELKPLDDEELAKEDNERMFLHEIEPDQNLDEELEPETVPREERRSKSRSSKERSRKQPDPPPRSESIAELSLSDILASESQEGTTEQPELKADAGSTAKAAPRSASRSGSGSQRQSARPGEQSLLRSPLVLGMVGVGALILLIFGTYRFMNFRQAVDERLEIAMDARRSGQYTQAIREFENFLVDYPRHDRTNEARVKMGLTKIQQYVGGGQPSWELGLEEIKKYRSLNKDLKEYSEENAFQELVGYVSDISAGAAVSAKRKLDPSLVAISEEATVLLQQLKPKDEKTEDHVARVKLAVEEANAAILKDNTLNEYIDEIKTAIEDNRPIDALEARRNLIARYSEFATSAEINALLEDALNKERELTVRGTDETESVGAEETGDVASVLSLARRTQAQSGNRSVGETIVVLSENCCYAVDTITGVPQWRRVVGSDTPFFPIEVSASKPALLMFNTHSSELLLRSKADGELIWRTAVDGQATGTPVVHEGQIFLPVAGETGGRLYQFDLETGNLTAQLSFSQPISSSPAISEEGKHLFVSGLEGVMYILTRRPLECVGIYDSGHAQGVIQAPLLTMGTFLLAIENDRETSCRLRLYDISQPEEGLQEAATARLEGHVTDTPVLWGQRLFVPSSDERVTAMTVTEETGQPPLTRVASFQNEAPLGVPIYLASGPDDLLWMAARDLRKFQLTLDSLDPDEKRMQVGLCAQPLQVRGDTLYIAGHKPSSRAVYFQGADRREMAGKWQVVLGAPILATSVSESDGALACVTATGDLFIVTHSQVSAGGFHTRPLTQLRVADDPDAAFHAETLQDGRMAVYSTGAKPHLWLINSNGSVTYDAATTEPLQSAPVEMGNALLLPLPGKLRLIGRTPGGGKVQDFTAPQTGAQPVAWKQLIALADDQVLALTASGTLSRIQLRQQPVPFLEDVASVELEHPIDVDVTAVGEQVILADAKPSLRVINGRSLEATAEFDLPLPAAQSPWVSDGRIFVQCGRDQLLCFSLGDEVTKLWEIPLPDTDLAGAPRSAQGALHVALKNGQIMRLDPESGEPVSPRSRLGQSIAAGPLLVGDALIVISSDGSLLSVNPPQKQEAQ